MPKKHDAHDDDQQEALYLTQKEYQQRMMAAHELMAAINVMQAKTYALWQVDNRAWDNSKRVEKELINLYHQADETLMALKEGTNVAHYG